jgi:hypothetical protein
MYRQLSWQFYHQNNQSICHQSNMEQPKRNAKSKSSINQQNNNNNNNNKPKIYQPTMLKLAKRPN